jgi:hypothetical protein
MASRAILGLLACAVGACAGPMPSYREPGALPEPTLREPPVLRVAVVGDFGDPGWRQRRVARALIRWNERRPFDLVLQPGDNVYNCGPNPRLRGAEGCRFADDGAAVEPGFEAPADPPFERNEGALRGLLGRSGEPVPIYLALGNHDVGEPRFCDVRRMARDEWMRRRACLEVARRSPGWRMPGRHYVLDVGPVRFIVVDSNVADADYAGFTLAAELRFVQEASAPCDGRRCFLVAHHPPALAVKRPPATAAAPWLVRMREIVAAGDGRLAGVLAGHAHMLEHLALDEVDVLIAGSSSRGRRNDLTTAWPPGARLRFASSAAGFGVLEAWDGGWSFRLVDERGRPLHCCEALGRERCRPVACRGDP